MADSDIRNELKRTKGDVAHTIVKAGLSLIPCVGGAATEIFSVIILPPISKRRDEWLSSIAEGLKRLEKEVKGFKIEELAKNDTFVTTVMHATQAAIRNHQTEKLEALHNAVLNAALSNAIEEDMQLMFLHFVDEFTPWHLKVLKFFEHPRKWEAREGISYPAKPIGKTVSQDLENAFPELSGKSEFYEQVVKDLSSRGLMDVASWGFADSSGRMGAQGVFDSHTTAMGQQFISFITSPLHNADKSSPA